jgi:Flp pilus assembly protein TadD
MATWRSPIPTVDLIPDYPDAQARRMQPAEALTFYRQRAAVDPTDSKAALGRAVALDRLARLRQVPQAQARVAYAQALRATPRNNPALGRLLELISVEEPAVQMQMLEQAALVSGGPAELFDALAEVADTLGSAALALQYRKQSKRIKALSRH